MKKIFGIVLGALLIAGGVLFALDALQIMSLDFSFEGWWTMFIIIPGLYSFLTSRDKTGSIIVIAIGVFLLLGTRDIIGFDILWKLILPLIAVIVGIKLIMRGFGKEEERTADGKPVYTVPPEKEQNADSKQSRICAIFGGTKCNLADMELKDGSEIDLLCVFGGADIIVPENVEIKTNSFCLFGGIDDKRALKNAEKTIRVTINGCCIFGGADIK